MFFGLKKRQIEREESVRKNDDAVEAIKKDAMKKIVASQKDIKRLTVLAEKHGVSGVLFVAMGGEQRSE